MESPEPTESGSALIKKAKDFAECLAELEVKADELLIDAIKVDQELANCRKFREEQLLKYLTEKNDDEEQMQLLRENIELKETAAEFHRGIALVMEKYREQSEGDMFIDSYQLKEKYLAGLAKVVQEQDARIERMLEMMKLTADFEDRSSDENQQIICQLTGENEQMRRQLQISSSDELFSQGTLGSSESGTQIGPDDSLDPDGTRANSICSVESFLSCLSPSHMGDYSECSSNESLLSELEVTCFIEEALAERPEEKSCNLED
ncbi:FGFR1 oncogene partner 2 homolog [Drosophila teissieri]|uniref:FGFR1 oncogene partner 2 homolog n=1 Tax=Drosophila teissieri TaxID=7243 RepID=UPI001CBA2B64|nr:FGFR1 oncogene partner 2 homolog [Drosophila teissieri]